MTEGLFVLLIFLIICLMLTVVACVYLYFQYKLEVFNRNNKVEEIIKELKGR